MEGLWVVGLAVIVAVAFVAVFFWMRKQTDEVAVALSEAKARAETEAGHYSACGDGFALTRQEQNAVFRSLISAFLNGWSDYPFMINVEGEVVRIKVVVSDGKEKPVDYNLPPGQFFAVEILPEHGIAKVTRVVVNGRLDDELKDEEEG